MPISIIPGEYRVCKRRQSSKTRMGHSAGVRITPERNKIYSTDVTLGLLGVGEFRQAGLPLQLFLCHADSLFSLRYTTMPEDTNTDSDAYSIRHEY